MEKSRRLFENRSSPESTKLLLRSLNIGVSRKCLTSELSDNASGQIRYLVNRGLFVNKTHVVIVMALKHVENGITLTLKGNHAVPRKSGTFFNSKMLVNRSAICLVAFFWP